MRSSKSRSRSKPNRPRSMGNVVNRVFDSSGPENKVRGTPQQIIDKYQVLARDAQLSNDRVAAENFLQHAEHYTRMLAEAQRDMQREADERNSSQQGRGDGQDGNRDGQQGGGQHGSGQQGGGQSQQRDDQRGERSYEGNRDGGRDDRDQSRGDGNRSDSNRGDGNRNEGARREDNRGEGNQRRQRGGGQMRATDVIDFSEGDSGLVETPEARRSPEPQAEHPPATEATEQAPEPAEAPPAKPRRRSPVRKPKPESGGDAGAKPDDDAPRKASAAE